MSVKIRETPKALRAAKETFWELLKDCDPFVRGTLNPIGIKFREQAAHSLVYREGENIKTTYIPAQELKEVRRMAGRYKEAKRLLNSIAGCELKLLKLRIEERKRKDEK